MKLYYEYVLPFLRLVVVVSYQTSDEAVIVRFFAYFFPFRFCCLKSHHDKQNVVDSTRHKRKFTKNE